MKNDPIRAGDHRLRLLLPLALAIFLAGRPAAAAMHFDEALQQAKTRSHALAAAHRETLRQGELQGAARGLYFPKVTLEGALHGPQR